MTICIAATCDLNVEQKIVLCTDWRTSSALGNAETMLKQRSLGRGWYVLTSGYESDIYALERLFVKRMYEDPPQHNNFADFIRHPLRQRKHDMASEYTSAKFGISYEDFLSFGKDKLPPDIYRDAIFEIKSLSLRAEFIVAGFMDGLPYTCQTTSNGDVSIRENFCAVGEGAYLATSALLQRGQETMTTLNRTIYQLFEAKKYAERTASVGPRTAIAILYPNGKRDAISPDSIEILDNLFKQYGPKVLPNDLAFGEKFKIDQINGPAEPLSAGPDS